MSGWHSIAIEYHGYPLDDNGKPLPGSKKLHIRVWLGADPDQELPHSVYQLDSIEDLRRPDGSCRVCNPTVAARKPTRGVEAAAAPCQGCGKPLQPGQLYRGTPTQPRHVWC